MAPRRLRGTTAHVQGRAESSACRDRVVSGPLLPSPGSPPLRRGPASPSRCNSRRAARSVRPPLPTRAPAPRTRACGVLPRSPPEGRTPPRRPPALARSSPSAERRGHPSPPSPVALAAGALRPPAGSAQARGTRPRRTPSPPRRQRRRPSPPGPRAAPPACGRTTRRARSPRRPRTRCPGRVQRSRLSPWRRLWRGLAGCDGGRC